MKIIPLIVSALVALPVALHAETPKAIVEGARETAAKAKKDVLMIFSGASWQPGSKNFEEKILQSEEFKKGAGDLVQALIPVPRTRDEAHKELLDLEKDYQFQGIPSVILTDAKGRPYAYSATIKEKPGEYLTHLQELRKIGQERDKMFEEGSKAEGLKKAELYVKALKTLPQNFIQKFYSPELKLIAGADPEGKTGYVQEIEKAAALKEEQERFNVLLRDKKYDEVIKQSREERAKLKGEDAQRLMMFAEIQAYYSQSKWDEASSVAEAMKQVAPDSDLGKRADQIMSQITGAKARQERMKEAAKNPKVKVPSKPIVSKPVAIVNDINELKKDARAVEAELAKAVANEEKLKKEKDELGKKIAGAEGELKKLREAEKISAEALKTAIAEREKLARKSQAMKDVVENHEAMEKRKRDINELEKRASELQKQADELRKKAGEIKTGK